MEMKTIYELWNELISRKQVGTARSYQDAFARFRKDNGLGVNFVEITPSFVDDWRRRMQYTLSKTTINIYLRAFSAILHLAYEYQFISIPPKFLFRGLGIFSKNASNSRKHCYLPASDWIKMWDFFENGGAESITFSKCRKDLQRKYLEALGLMLFMYLGNGMNLRDVCMLRYNRHYFQTGGK